MSKEIVDKNNPTPKEYENIIEELMKENEALKKRIAELEKREKVDKKPQDVIKDIPTPVDQEETKKQVKLSKKSKKKEISEPIIVEEKKLVAKSIFSQDVSPLEMGKGPIVEGTSRRECPICGNSSKALIREITDKSHILMDYPRIYGKKFRCGECGREWRLQVEM